MNSFMQHHHPSKIYLPGKKADWHGLVILHAIDVSLLASTFVKILKLTLSMQMGLYC
jgi:hypothetical protein